MRYRLVLTGIALAACVASDAPELSAPEPLELTGMTMFHNQVRAMVDTTGVAGGPLLPLTWDPMLAATAAAWVKQCKSTNGILLDHNPDRSAGYPWPVGENIYASDAPSAWEAVMNPGHGWAAEAMFYHYATNTCDPNETCGHYTQLVWRATQKVGCALGVCSGSLVFPSVIVCDYGPAGNIDGEQPY